VSRELLAEAIREEKQQPKVCLLHERPVVFDEGYCPCCRIIMEVSSAQLGSDLTD